MRRRHAIRHICNRHGNNEAVRGQVDMTPEDIAVIPYIVNNFDTMELVESKNDKMGNRAIEVHKRINGVSVVPTIEKGKDKEFVVSSWVLKKSDATDASTRPHGPTSDNDSDILALLPQLAAATLGYGGYRGLPM